MSYRPMVHFTAPDGQLSTIWNFADKVADLKAAEPIIKRSLAQARRAGGTRLVIDVFDDLACVSAFRGRVK